LLIRRLTSPRISVHCVMAARGFMASTLQGRRWEIQAFLTAATLAHSSGRNRVACETWAFSPAEITVQHLPSTAQARLQVRPTPTTPCTLLAGQPQPVSKISALSGTNASQAFAINDQGQIAGSSGTHAVIWNNGAIQDLG